MISDKTFLWIHRLLSNTVCKFAKDCPAIEWPVIYAPYAFSKYCIEISGLCGNNNQCWGLDSTTHACLLSRWMFIRLHGLISSFWPRLAEVAEIIKCSSRLYPEERCSWAYMRNKLEELRKFAQTEVKGLWWSQGRLVWSIIQELPNDTSIFERPQLTQSRPTRSPRQWNMARSWARKRESCNIDS